MAWTPGWRNESRFRPSMRERRNDNAKMRRKRSLSNSGNPRMAERIQHRQVRQNLADRKDCYPRITFWSEASYRKQLSGQIRRCWVHSRRSWASLKGFSKRWRLESCLRYISPMKGMGQDLNFTGNFLHLEIDPLKINDIVLPLFHLHWLESLKTDWTTKFERRWNLTYIENKTRS